MQVTQIVVSDEQSNIEQELLNDNEYVVKLGIQAPEGTKFQINGGNEIKIGKTCIYELDLEGIGQITSIKCIRLAEREIALIDVVGGGFFK